MPSRFFDVMGGKAYLRGMRVTVGMIVGQIGAGHTIEEILTDYPYLEREDVLQALRVIRICDFEFVSFFDIRISDLLLILLIL